MLTQGSMTSYRLTRLSEGSSSSLDSKKHLTEHYKALNLLEKKTIERYVCDTYVCYVDSFPKKFVAEKRDK
jgi:hypothetical protein